MSFICFIQIYIEYCGSDLMISLYLILMFDNYVDIPLASQKRVATSLFWSFFENGIQKHIAVPILPSDIGKRKLRAFNFIIFQFLALEIFNWDVETLFYVP